MRREEFAEVGEVGVQGGGELRRLVGMVRSDPAASTTRVLREKRRCTGSAHSQALPPGSPSFAEQAQGANGQFSQFLARDAESLAQPALGRHGGLAHAAAAAEQCVERWQFEPARDLGDGIFRPEQARNDEMNHPRDVNIAHAV
jgi:hypothetical protein